MIIRQSVDRQMISPNVIADMTREILSTEDEFDQMKEHFWVIGLDNMLRVKYVELNSLGILDQSLVHCREVFRHAISYGIKSLVTVHNHPSGEVKPSTSDIELTKRLAAAGYIIAIKLVDHIIITEEDFYSFNENMSKLLDDSQYRIILKELL